MRKFNNEIICCFEFIIKLFEHQLKLNPFKYEQKNVQFLCENIFG